MAKIKTEALRDKGIDYEFIPPIATENVRGGFLASAKDDSYQAEVKLGEDGKLYSKNSTSIKLIQWPTDVKYVVTYYVDTNIKYVEEVQMNKSCLSPTSFTPELDGYNFLGWKENTNADSDVLKNRIADTKGITLYAVFSKEVVLTYDGNSATTGSVNSQNGTAYYNNGNAVNPSFVLSSNGFTKTEYVFVGWDLGAAGETITLTESVTTYAQWVQTVTSFAYTGGIQTYTVPATGKYYLETYGSQGAGSGGKGGYSKGYKDLTKGTTLYIVVGGTGGYNGGGSGVGSGSAGGGATHIALSTGLLSSLSSSKSDVLIVAGGGGGSSGGGAGGGTSGGSGSWGSGDRTAIATGGTQTSGGSGGYGINDGFWYDVDGDGNDDYYVSETGGYGGGGSFGKGGNGGADATYGGNAGGGGGGYYGGGGGGTRGTLAAGAGGSGYIGGVSEGSTTSGSNTGNGKANITFVSAA